METIQKGLEYALRILKDQADNGYYPKAALQDNGGEGFEPITKALEIVKNNVDLANVSNSFYCWESGEVMQSDPLCKKQCEHCKKIEGK